MLKEAFKRNFPAISEEEQERLRGSHVCVVGCGGLGGFSIEYLARLGIGCITVIDGDVFECTNLNRQLLCTSGRLGRLKAEAAEERIHAISPDTEVRVSPVYLDANNAAELLTGADLVLDALDSVKDRLILADACRKLEIPLVHGAVQGWNAQVAVVYPESRTLEQIYGDASGDSGKSCLSFTPGLCAAIQCAEAVKILTGKEPGLKSRLLAVDLQALDFEILQL